MAGWLAVAAGTVWFVGLVANAVDRIGADDPGLVAALGWALAPLLPLCVITLGLVMARSPRAVATWQPLLCFIPAATASGIAAVNLWSSQAHPSWIGATAAATVLLIGAAFPEDRAELDTVLRGRRIGLIVGGLMGAAAAVSLAWRWLPALDPLTAALGPAGVWLAVPAALVAAVAAVATRTVLAAFAVAVFLLMSIFTEPFAGFRGDRCAPDDEPTANVRVLAANVLFETRNTDPIVDLIADRQPDIIVLSELPEHVAGDLEDRLPGHPYRLVVPSTISDGLGIYSRWPLAEAVVGPMIGNDRLAATIDTPAGVFRLHGVHLTAPISPTNVDLWQADFEHLVGVVAAERTPALVIGDFNATHQNVELRRFLADTELVDAASGCGWRPSWPVGYPVPPTLALDHAFHSPELKVVEPVFGELEGSDHRWIEIEIEVAVD